MLERNDISEQKDYIRDLELTRAHRSDVRS